MAPIKGDFAGFDLDITVITDSNMSKSQKKAMEAAYKSEFKRKLGVRHITESQIKQLDHIPIYGKIDMDF